MDNIFKKFHSNMSETDFIKYLIELDKLDTPMISEYDENLLSDFYNTLGDKCGEQIENIYTSPITGKLILPNRQISLKDLMWFLKSINY